MKMYKKIWNTENETNRDKNVFEDGAKWSWETTHFGNPVEGPTCVLICTISMKKNGTNVVCGTQRKMKWRNRSHSTSTVGCCMERQSFVSLLLMKSMRSKIPTSNRKAVRAALVARIFVMKIPRALTNEVRRKSLTRIQPEEFSSQRSSPIAVAIITAGESVLLFVE